MKRKIIVEKQDDTYFVGIETKNKHGTAKHGMSLTESELKELLTEIIEKKRCTRDEDCWHEELFCLMTQELDMDMTIEKWRAIKTFVEKLLSKKS